MSPMLNVRLRQSACKDKLNLPWTCTLPMETYWWRFLCQGWTHRIHFCFSGAFRPPEPQGGGPCIRSSNKNKYIYIYIYIYIFIYFHVYIYTYTDMYIYIYVCVCVYASIDHPTIQHEWLGNGRVRMTSVYIKAAWHRLRREVFMSAARGARAPRAKH